MEAPSPKRRNKLAWQKKLLFTVITLTILGLPLALAAEVIYRSIFSIPLTGGTVYKGDLRTLETPHSKTFLSRFQESDNPVLFYEPRPNYSDELYSINSDGFRDREFPREKPPGVFRIACLGDSIVWGHGVRLEYTLAKQLERILSQDFPHQKFEVMNFGVSGYSTQQEVELYRVKAAKFDPDLVVVGYCLNDFMESSVEGRAFRQLYYDIYSKSYLYAHLKRAFLGLTYNELGLSWGTPQAQFDLREQFQRLQSYCDDRTNAVVIFPMLIDFNNYFPAVEHDRARQALDGLNFEVLDLYDHFKDFNPDTLILNARDRTHPNERGTRVAAQATADFLVAKKLVPTGAPPE